MRGGSLRHRVALQRQQKIKDRGGGFSEGWVTYREAWCELSMPSGRLNDIAEQLDELVTLQATLRFRRDIRTGDRLFHDGQAYRIEAVLPDNKQSMLRLMCSSVQEGKP